MDLTSGSVFVHDGVPLADVSLGLDLVQIDDESADQIVVSDLIFVHELDGELGWLGAHGDGDGVVPVGVFAALLADLGVDSVFADDEGAVGFILLMRSVLWVRLASMGLKTYVPGMIVR